jgi:hypothetical protein
VVAENPEEKTWWSGESINEKHDREMDMFIGSGNHTYNRVGPWGNKEENDS